MKKKLFALIIMVAMLALVACSSEDTNKESDSKKENSSTQGWKDKITDDSSTSDDKTGDSSEDKTDLDDKTDSEDNEGMTDAFVWEVQGECVAITNLTEAGEKLNKIVVPATIDGKKVNSIDDGAFYSSDALVEITLPDSIRYIGDKAFGLCTKLEKITLPEGIEYIGNEAFSSCNALTEITVPNSVNYIGVGAFSSCDMLEKVTLPEGITSIERGMFKNSKSLKEVNIPDGVIKINNGAYYGCEGLTNVVIPESVISIADEAFAYCNGMKEIKLPKSMKYLGNNVFQNCTSLEKIDMPKELYEIGTKYFNYCSSLKEIEMPYGIYFVEVASFLECTSLESIKIPSSVVSIGADFGELDNVKKVYVESGSYAEEWAKEKGFAVENYTCEKIKENLYEFGVYEEYSRPETSLIMPEYVANRLNIQPTDESNFQWEDLEDGTVRVARVKEGLKEVCIPETLGGKKVTDVSWFGLGYGLEDTEVLVIPSGVTQIEALGSGYENIEYIKFNGELESLSGFDSCESLKAVVIPSCKKINVAFIGSENLVHIEWPQNLEMLSFTSYNLPILELPKNMEYLDLTVGAGTTMVIAPENVTNLEGLEMGTSIPVVKEGCQMEQSFKNMGMKVVR